MYAANPRISYRCCYFRREVAWGKVTSVSHCRAPQSNVRPFMRNIASRTARSLASASRVLYLTLNESSRDKACGLDDSFLSGFQSPMLKMGDTREPALLAAGVSSLRFTRGAGQVHRCGLEIAVRMSAFDPRVPAARLANIFLLLLPISPSISKPPGRLSWRGDDDAAVPSPGRKPHRLVHPQLTILSRLLARGT